MTVRRILAFDWFLWLLWIMATTWGWILGGIVLPGIQLAAAGVGVAAFQWLVAQRQLTKAWRWPAYSAVGWAAGLLAALALGHFEGGFLAGLLLGATTGVGQWLVLRREVRWAGWWIPISVVGWSTGLSMALAALLAGVAAGAVTGIALVLLLSNARKPSDRAK